MARGTKPLRRENFIVGSVVGCAVVGILSVAVSIAFWSVPLSLAGLTADGAAWLDFTLREIRFLPGRNDNDQLRLDGTQGERVFLRRTVSGGKRFEAIRAAVRPGDRVCAGLAGDDECLALNLGEVCMLPFQEGYDRAWADAKGFAALAAFMDAVGLIFCVRAMVLCRRRRCATGVSGLGACL